MPAQEEGAIVRKIGLTGWIFIGILLGAACGHLIGKPLLAVSQPMGTVFLTLLKMVIVPLILSSIITGVAGIGDTGRLGRMGAKTLVYYLTTSLLAILTGLMIVNLVKPGVGAELGLAPLKEEIAAEGTGVLDILLRMIPENPVQAAAEGRMLPLIFFAIIFGVFITRVENETGRPVQSFIAGVFEVMMKMTRFIIHLTPFGAFGLVGSIVARTGFAPFIPLGKYAACVVAALAIHGCLTLPLLLRFVGGINPVKHIKAMAPALMTAFSTASSSATLPLTMECAEARAGVSNRTSSFVLPLGATVNMDGTALYECVAVMFIAQYYFSHGQHDPLTLAQQTVVVLTALLASIGAAGIPLAGLVMMSVCLHAVGLPLAGIGLILAVDQVLDMCRTTINVWSDSCGTVIIASTEGETGIKVRAGR
ncbi:MAG: dicarboxylate/amino acid:cation symporter [Candidatus Glassbacteria bacterium]|nr:dicarboxylate/amino acid:cation symporter [Candidatus Glassbacteria bacterium]